MPQGDGQLDCGIRWQHCYAHDGIAVAMHVFAKSDAYIHSPDPNPPSA
ncbi:MAG: hypothetical protein GMKNLPBB_02915 [Myxococcota bacterium]|nr:hypothetical protein [Myxococcota bacterium]